MRVDIAYAQVLEDNTRGINRTEIAQKLDERMRGAVQMLPDRSTWGLMPEHQQASQPLFDIASAQ